MSQSPTPGGYDPFRIDSIAEIDQLLLDIIKQGALVRMHSSASSEATITTLVDVDFDKERLFIDAAAQQSTNDALIRHGTVHCDTQINHVSIEFQLTLLEQTVVDGHTTLIGTLPLFVRRIQRRDSFRVQPHTSNPASCTLEFDNQTITLPIFDISASGVSLLDKKHIFESLDLPKGYVFEACTLELPGIGKIDLDLKLVRQQDQGSVAGKTVSRYGYAFFSFTPADKIRIQNYINQEERLRIARERGLA